MHFEALFMQSLFLENLFVFMLSLDFSFKGVNVEEGGLMDVKYNKPSGAIRIKSYSLNKY